MSTIYATRHGRCNAIRANEAPLTEEHYCLSTKMHRRFDDSVQTRGLYVLREGNAASRIESSSLIRYSGEATSNGFAFDSLYCIQTYDIMSDAVPYACLWWWAITGGRKMCILKRASFLSHTIASHNNT